MITVRTQMALPVDKVPQPDSVFTLVPSSFKVFRSSLKCVCGIVRWHSRKTRMPFRQTYLRLPSSAWYRNQDVTAVKLGKE